MTGKEYIFYTDEGYTQAPDEGIDVENLQVLGFAFGRDKSEAKQDLLEKSPWIKEYGFDPAYIVCRQIFDEEYGENLRTLLSAIDRLRVRHPDIFQTELGNLSNSIIRLKELL